MTAGYDDIRRAYYDAQHLYHDDNRCRASAPVSMLVVRVVVKHSQKNFVGQQNALGDLNGHVEEMIRRPFGNEGINGEKDSLDEFHELNDTLYQNAWKAQFLSGLMMPVLNFVSNLGYVGVCVLGGYLATKQIVEIGDTRRSSSIVAVQPAHYPDCKYG